MVERTTIRCRATSRKATEAEQIREKIRASFDGGMEDALRNQHGFKKMTGGDPPQAKM